ncbi:MAG: LuxR C-terminal-related transcriptional regulator [Cyclobacteriaceae bacterium]|jgi:DNA-binding CsgD family transcriptional regulator|nr:helix-turn-helix transcriptional regulator [Cytophagales bacterium]HNP77033.1 LuxR C-terminal-related transcriptional regulator [Cyclobacteriaceae bacterium]
MSRTVLLYAISLAVLISILRFAEYRFLVRDVAMEAYLGVIAVMFTVLGVWVGLRLTRKKVVYAAAEVVIDDQAIARLGISKREQEVLTWLAQGLSNQEIADKMFVSVNTVKTHLSNLFQKLNASRRTQAIQRAKELGVLR